jgi:small-conductance mechanosensitive channel
MEIPQIQLPPLDVLLARSVAVLAILAGAVLVRFLVSRGLDLLAGRTRLSTTDVAPLRKIAGWLVTAVAFVLLLGAFGIELTGVWAVLTTVLAMIAIGFVAVWSILSNVSCTFVILFFRPFNIGDEIEFAGEPVKGRVVDLNFLFTTIQTEDDAVMQIPNNLVFQKVLKRRHGHGAVSLAEKLGRRSEETVGAGS